MWSARTQYINLKIPAFPAPVPANLYIVAFKFDPPYRKYDIGFQITYGPPGQANPNCDNCANGETRPLNTCICPNCVFNKIGKLCSRMLKKI